MTPPAEVAVIVLIHGRIDNGEVSLVVWWDPRHGLHDPGPGHPERPERVEACLRAIRSEVVREAPEASREDLERVHSHDYLIRLERFCASGGGWVTPDTYAGADSFAVASRAAGAVAAAVEQAASSGERGFCVVRPPGHHASVANPMGFCLINNVAVGAARALAVGVGRVMIVDFDVHHGNGTQEIFWDTDRVVYVSLHQWPWYPWTTGSAEETGEGGGRGSNLNIPLRAGAGDLLYEKAMHEMVVPAVLDAKPDLILLSAGFDAHSRDPLGMMSLSETGFARIVATMLSLADRVAGGRIVTVLEGGYDLGSLAASAAACAGVLGGQVTVAQPLDTAL